MQRIVLGNENSTHLYEIGVRINGKEFSIDVNATNRDQAARIAARAGYEVCWVNMVG